MKRSNNDRQGSDKSTYPKKQIILGAFLMKNESNLKSLAKATLKRHIWAELAEEDKAVEHKKHKALKKFKKLYNINNTKLIRKGAQTAMKYSIVNIISEYDKIYLVNKSTQDQNNTKINTSM